MKPKKPEDLWLEFLSEGMHCGLCGNSGMVNTIGITTAAGVGCGIARPCICPNGRAIKKHQEQKEKR